MPPKGIHAKHPRSRCAEPPPKRPKGSTWDACVLFSHAIRDRNLGDRAADASISSILDIIDQMLIYTKSDRISAAQALRHPCFQYIGSTAKKHRVVRGASASSVSAESL